tara:strand:+ start:257 stop:649 length:393 start_codon:yes stop_codon:yes gene_type:complete
MQEAIKKVDTLYDNPDDVKVLQERLKELGFNIEVDGVFDRKTKKANYEYGLYIKNNFDDDRIKLYNDTDVVNMSEKPFQLLEQGDANLFDKAVKNPNLLTDDEYGKAFPDTKTNKEILKDVDIFEFLKRQ